MTLSSTRSLSLAFALTLGLAACGGSATSGSGGASSATTTSAVTTGAGGAGGDTTTTTGSTGGGGGAPVDKAKDCASTFGAALTSSFGRLDGTILAVVQPGNPTCALPNGTHLVLQTTMGGAAYRMVVNIKSDSGDPDVFFRTLPHALPPPAWADGWHTGVTLDYVKDLGLHSGDGFAQHPMAELASIVTAPLVIGAKVSVYATSSGGASAHLVHRNDGKADGTIVIDPDGASPTMLLFHFPTQTF